MRPEPGEWDDLRLAAKAADRRKAAKKLRPAFEKRLRELGYGPRATAHAFTTLQGSGTVAEALTELAHHEGLERIRPVRFAFETVEQEPALPLGHSLTITGVGRDGGGIRITYEIRPPLASLADRPRVGARDDCGQEYRRLGESLGLAGSKGRTATIGAFTMPLPQQHASLLRVPVSWSHDSTSVWESSAHELRIIL